MAEDKKTEKEKKDFGKDTKKKEPKDFAKEAKSKVKEEDAPIKAKGEQKESEKEIGKEAKAAPKKKKERKNVQIGKAFIKATFNNTIITITDQNGNVLCWSSAGNVGFKGSRKSTHYAAQLAASNAAKKAMDQGMRNISVYVKGPGAGREAAIRAIQGTGIKISLIKDITPIPHNGCRPPKKRRV